MPRPPKPTDLTINLKPATDTAQTTPGSNSSPINVDLSSFGGGDFGDHQPGHLTSLPPLPSSPPTSPRHHRDPSKNFFGTFKSRVSPEQERDQQKGQARQGREENEDYRPSSSSMSKIYHLRKNPGSTPELSLVGSAESSGKSDTDVTTARPQPSPHHSQDSIASRRKENKPFRNPLIRTKSIRRDSDSKGNKPDYKTSFEQAPKTAPFQSPEWSNSDMNLLKARSKEKRGKSAERAVASEGDENTTDMRSRFSHKEKDNKGGFMTSSRNAMSKATKATKGSGGLFTRLGKIGRSSSHNEKDVSDSEYKIKVINLPLVEQTRITRISKDLGSCRDKTEFWMPSLPWRCIDYLNLNCESEGLYRIPGSGPQVKHWQRRFDAELDVDLLDEEELYDPNTIGSMLKSWLRDLPTEIMSASAQSALAVELEKDNPEYAKMGQPAPQKLRDALSDLSPFNYYLLFAITCHLSLLLSHKEKNKMDLNNLSICIGPPLKLERWLFNYLVGDWRHCWQGCFTEKQYLESEKAHELGVEYEGPDAESQNDGNQGALAEDMRLIHSSGSTSGDSKASEQTDPWQQSGIELRPRVDSKPETYLPAGTRQTSNGSVGSPTQRGSPPIVEVKRPSTAEEQKRVDGSSSNTATPRQPSHGRSRSDVATTPVVGGSPSANYQFPMPGRS